MKPAIALALATAFFHMASLSLASRTSSGSSAFNCAIISDVDGRSDIADSLVAQKHDEMQKATTERGRPIDDVKASAGPIMNVLKRELSLTQCGNTVKEFMRVTLAPLLNSSLPVYVELRASVFPSVP